MSKRCIYAAGEHDSCSEASGPFDSMQAALIHTEHRLLFHFLAECLEINQMISYTAKGKKENDQKYR